MFDNLRFFWEYRKQNRIFSKALKIKRDIKVELFLLFGLWKSKRLENLLKRNCRCYLAYYEKRGIETSFKDLDYITARILAIYSILYDKELLQTEIENFDNVFSQEYVREKIKQFTLNDAGMKNLVEEAAL